MKVKIQLLSIFALYFLISCDPKTLPVPNEQEILFHVSYANFAWGKQQNGFLIDKSGQIYTYNNPSKWNASTNITSQEMAENLSAATLSSIKIPTEELEEFALKIYTIDPKKLTEMVCPGADMGAGVVAAYNYNPKNQTYQELLLSMTGDCNSKNEDKPAIQTTEWLQEVRQRLR